VNISENVVFVKDFNEMQQIVSQLTVMPSEPPKISIRTKSAKKASFDIIYKEQFAIVELQILAAVRLALLSRLSLAFSCSSSLACKFSDPIATYS
jgi:hypothetical protein